MTAKQSEFQKVALLDESFSLKQIRSLFHF